jgi:tetratricopeptide (TPR) repeat protein
MLSKRLLLVILLSVFSATQACANQINQRNAIQHAQAGGRAASSGDWDTARKEWAQAVKNGELGGIPEKHQAVFYYEYARAAGVTCHFDVAETYLNKAYELDKKIGGPYFLSLVELFRLNLDQKKYDIAVSHFEKALPVLEEINAPSQSPAEFAKLLDEYAMALDGTGKSDQAKKMRERSSEVKKKAENSITDRTPYGTSCSKSES